MNQTKTAILGSRVIFSFSLNTFKEKWYNIISFASPWDKQPQKKSVRSVWGSRRAPSRVRERNVSVITTPSLSYLGLHLSLAVQEFAEPPFPDSPPFPVLWSWGDPHSWRMIDRAAARRKGSCDVREKERSVYPCPSLCFYLPSCLPRPCPHNRVLTGAVSRNTTVTTVGTGVSREHISSVFVWHWKPASYS